MSSTPFRQPAKRIGLGYSELVLSGKFNEIRQTGQFRVQTERIGRTVQITFTGKVEVNRSEVQFKNQTEKVKRQST